MSTPIAVRLEELEFLAAVAYGDPDAVAAAHPDVCAGLSPVGAAVCEALLSGRGDFPRIDQAHTLLRGRADAAALLDEVLAATPTRMIPELVSWLRNRAYLRNLKSASRAVLALADDPTQVSAAAGTLAGALAASVGELPVNTLRGSIDEYLRVANGDEPVLIGSGIPLIDEIAGGWRRGGLHLVLGLTGRGKSALLVQTTEAMARAGYHVYLVSCEMTTVDLVPRFLAGGAADVADADGAPLSSARLSRFDPDAVATIPTLVRRLGPVLDLVHVDTAPMPSWDELATRIARVHAAQPLDAVVIDYLQLVTGKGERREEQVRDVAVRAKGLGRQLNCVVICASQLPDPPPWSKDILEVTRTPAPRESRAAAHAADLVLELDRTNDVLGPQLSYRFRISKARHVGADRMEAEMIFDRRTCRFLPVSSPAALTPAVTGARP